jgi:hypothetical protein
VLVVGAWVGRSTIFVPLGEESSSLAKALPRRLSDGRSPARGLLLDFELEVKTKVGKGDNSQRLCFKSCYLSIVFVI